MGYYREFIPRYAATARPLFALLPLEGRWPAGTWQAKHARAVAQLHRDFKEHAVLHNLLPNLPVRIIVDASAEAASR